MALDTRTPVLVGAGVAHQRSDDPAAALEAVELMALASERAAVDTEAPGVLREVGTILTPRGTWRYPDPGRILAERFGASARTVIADVGVLQQSLFTRACEGIASGAFDVALVCGAEAKFRDLRARITGVEGPLTRQGDVMPDEILRPSAEIMPRAEIDAGLISAPLQYAVIETALRAGRGESIAENARVTAELWAAFSDVAARNPDAWRREPVTPDFLEHPSPANPMLAAPYTKWHCSQWNVDQAAAFVVCSAETAVRHGVPRDRWVFPLAAVESNHMVPISQRAELHRAPAVRAVGDRLAELSGIAIPDVDHVDLYSCFPAAVRVQAAELGLPTDRALTVTGGMTFGGGPLNNAVLQATAKMIEVLRADPESIGLVTSISGMITKHGAALWSTRPPDGGFAAADVSAVASERTEVRTLLADHDGAAAITAYTVSHDKGAPAYAAVIASTPSGEHVAARNDDREVATAMAANEWIGRDVRVRGSHFDA